MAKAPDLVDDGAVVTLNSQRVIAYRPEIAKYFDDSPNIAIYFQQLYHWQQFTTRPDKYFYKSAQEMYEETGISAKRQRKCRESLEGFGWIATKKEMANGHPTLHFRVLITLNTVIALGEKTNGNSQKDKSITQEDNTISKFSSETKEQIEKVYDVWLKLMVVDPAVRAHGTTDERRDALAKARNRTRLTDLRKTRINARLKSMGLEKIIGAIKHISQSDWHRGINDDNWTASLEWLCKSDEKIEEWANKGGGQ